MMIFGMKYASAALPFPGQFEYVASNSVGSDVTTFVVPDGVFELSLLVVSMNSTSICKISRAGVDLINSSQEIGSGSQGGGNGGALGDNNPSFPEYNGQGGQGGAGGYAGSGGKGGTVGANLATASQGGDGSGGGGGGGCGSYTYNNAFRLGLRGGGIGMRGQGASGAGGNLVLNPDGTHSAGWGLPGSNSDPLVGAGTLSGSNGTGGNLRWKNFVSVTPGDVLTINLGSASRDATNGTGAGARIMWYGNRSYPSNAANL